MNDLPDIAVKALGSQPLKNVRWEYFCQALSRAAPPTLVEAYFEACDAIGKRSPTQNAARVAASNLVRKSAVDERIAFLRGERLKQAHEPSEALTERRIQDMLSKCTETLVNAAKAADAAGLGAAQVSAIRKSIVVHEGRRTRSQKYIDEVPKPQPQFRWKVPDWCACDQKESKSACEVPQS